MIGLVDAVRGADYVVTGEGSFDAQSAAGKVPGYVADLARDAGVPVGLVAGRIGGDADVGAFVDVRSLSGLAGSPHEAMAEPRHYLAVAAAGMAARVEA
nr:glycerate kinase [Tessaracoccus coleopterorum]